MEKNFYDEQECKDLKTLNIFNDDLDFFTEISGTAKYDHIDAYTYTRGIVTNKLYPTAIELKERYNEKGFKDGFSGATYSTVFIEPVKLSMLRQHIYKNKEINQSIYVNIFSDGNEIAIWNIKTCKNIGYKASNNINDKGAQKYKNEPRYLLPLSGATYFTIDKTTKKYIKTTNPHVKG